MNKIKVYLDTSVISYLDQKDAPERMKETHDVWEIFRKGYYEIYISDVVVYEINKCSREKREILLDYLDQIDYNIIETEESTVGFMIYPPSALLEEEEEDNYEYDDKGTSDQ